MITKSAKPVKTLVYKAFRGFSVRKSRNQEDGLSGVSMEKFPNVGQVVGQIQKGLGRRSREALKNYHAIIKERRTTENGDNFHHPFSAKKPSTRF